MTDPAVDRDVRRALLWGTLAVVAIAAVGYLLSWEIAHSWIGQPAPGVGNAYFYLFGEYERPFLLLVAGSSVATALWLLGGPTEGNDDRTGHGWLGRIRPLPVAVLVVLVTRMGARFAMHDYPLSMDEFNAVFQSRIFASGRIAAVVPPEWRDLVTAIKPTFVTYRPEDGTWLSSYLPVYAAIRTIFLAVRLDSLVNPLLSGLSVLAIAGVARRLWPRDRRREGLAVLMLATSSQFLLMGMSGYAMQAHLLLNLTWLLLYLDNGRITHLAPWVGILALGLHNPFPHALFVTPFLVRMITGRDWHRLWYFGLVYSLGAIAWLCWWAIALPAEGPGGGAQIFGLPGGIQLAFQAMNISMIVAWAVPVFGLGIATAIGRWHGLDVRMRDLSYGLALTLVFYSFYLTPQGHGWGYRYFHPVLGGASLLSGLGLTLIAQVADRKRLRLVIISSLVVAIAIQLPSRSRNAEKFLAPWASASRHLEAMGAQVVALPTDSIWYGRDLIRNDPYLRAPILLGCGRYAPHCIQRAAARTPGGAVHVMGTPVLRRFGLTTWRSQRR